MNFLRDTKKWEEIRTSDSFAHLRDMLWQGYNEICKDKEIPIIPFSANFQFVKTGERFPGENPYFIRRKQLAIYAVLCMIYPEKEEYLTKLEDLICVICEEHSWCVPAHLPLTNFNSQTNIDLFAAETGAYLAEIKHMMITRLNHLVIERITDNLDRRIIQPFKNETFFFENLKSNWAAVCGGSVGMVLMYENPKVFSEMRLRLDDIMKRYMEGIGNDGSISEGVSYWQYGFGYYLIYQDMLKRFSFGRINRLNDEKVKKAAGFFSNILMSKSVMYSYSDGSQRSSVDPFLLSYVEDICGAGVQYDGLEDLWFSKFTYLVRDFLWYKPRSESSAQNPECFFDRMGCYILRKDKYAFAIKAGHNKEEHNHNDVGSFVVVSNDKQLFCDLGAPVYTAYTLSDKAYNDVVQKASFGHNVPIVNGEGQGYGRDYSGTISVSGDTVTVEFKDAYINKPTKLVRKSRLMEDKIILTDTFGEEDTFIERFVTEIEPQIGDGYIKIDCMTASFDKDKWRASYQKHITQHHSGEERIVFLIDVAGDKESVFEMEITFAENVLKDGEKI